MSHHTTSALNIWTKGYQSLPIKHWPVWTAEVKLKRHLYQCHLSPQSWRSKVEVPRASWKPWKANRSGFIKQPFYWPRPTPTAKEWSSCFLIWCPVPDNRRNKNHGFSLKKSQWNSLKRQMTSVGLRYGRAPRHKSDAAYPYLTNRASHQCLTAIYSMSNIKILLCIVPVKTEVSLLKILLDNVILTFFSWWVIYTTT